MISNNSVGLALEAIDDERHGSAKDCVSLVDRTINGKDVLQEKVLTRH